MKYLYFTKYQINCIIGLMLFIGICIGSYWQKQAYKPLGELQEGQMHSIITNQSDMSFYADGRITYIHWKENYTSRDVDIEFIDKDIVKIISINCRGE